MKIFKLTGHFFSLEGVMVQYREGVGAGGRNKSGLYSLVLAREK